MSFLPPQIRNSFEYWALNKMKSPIPLPRDRHVPSGIT